MARRATLGRYPLAKPAPIAYMPERCAPLGRGKGLAMKILFFILIVLLITQIGFWHTLGAILGAILMMILLLALAIAVVVVGGILLLVTATR